MLLTFSHLKVGSRLGLGAVHVSKGFLSSRIYEALQ